MWPTHNFNHSLTVFLLKYNVLVSVNDDKNVLINSWLFLKSNLVLGTYKTLGRNMKFWQISTQINLKLEVCILEPGTFSGWLIENELKWCTFSVNLMCWKESPRRWTNNDFVKNFMQKINVYWDKEYLWFAWFQKQNILFWKGNKIY